MGSGGKSGGAIWRVLGWEYALHLFTRVVILSFLLHEFGVVVTLCPLVSARWPRVARVERRPPRTKARTRARARARAS